MLDKSAPNTSVHRDAPNILWNESTDMFKTTKQHLQEEPFTRVNYYDYVPYVEDKRNKKNESIVDFAHRIDLKLLSNIATGKMVDSGRFKKS
jgi:hypothetical protein